MTRVRKFDKVFGVVIQTQVIAQSPNDDRRMIPVALHHLPHLLFQVGNKRTEESLCMYWLACFHRRPVEMNLDIRNLFPDKNTEPVAGIEDRGVLGIVRGSNEVTAHILNDLDIADSDNLGNS